MAYVHEPGSYAEKSLVDAEFLIPHPPDLSFEEAAAFPLQGMTAHYLYTNNFKIWFLTSLTATEFETCLVQIQGVYLSNSQLLKLFVYIARISWRQTK